MMLSDDLASIRLKLEQLYFLDGAARFTGKDALALIDAIKDCEREARSLEEKAAPSGDEHPLINAETTNVVPFDIWHAMKHAGIKRGGGDAV